jgi:hypothetical protein
MTHKERKARFHAITQVRERNRPPVEEQLTRLLQEKRNPQQPMPWDEQPDTDEPA